MTQYLGDKRFNTNVDFIWSSYNSLGASVAPSSNGSITVYKDNSSTGTKVGVTDTRAFGSNVGIHQCRISMASTTGFFTPGSMFHVVTSGESIDGQFVNAVLASFTVEAQYIGQGLTGTPQGIASQSITFPASTFSDDDDVAGWHVELIQTSTGSRSAAQIASAVAATQVATMDRAWTNKLASEATANLYYRVYPDSLPTTLSETTAAIDSLGYATTAELNSGVTITSSTFTINANLQQINDVTLVGDGSTTSWGP